MRNELRSSTKPDSERKPVPDGSTDSRAEEIVQNIQDLMWRDVGIVRTGAGLKNGILHLEELRPRIAHPQTRRGHEAQNLVAAGMLVARSALAREESRGAHYRTDFPDHNDAKFLKHSIIQGDTIRFV
jgi:L-aspartate oxidase